jgi:hypothetical protein
MRNAAPRRLLWRVAGSQSSINVGLIAIEAASGRLFFWDTSVAGLSFFERRHPRCPELALLRLADCIEQCPLSEATRKTFVQLEFFSFDPTRIFGLLIG